MEAYMRRAAVIAACVAGLVLATAPAALGDPPKPLYQVDCPGLSSVIVTSPDHAAAGMDLESTHVFVGPPGHVPETQTMTCTVSELHPGGEVFEVAFLIAPATH
jgi:hypothetical protein